MPDDPVPARTVAERYRLDRLIGRGGSGAVWRAFDERLRRPVAVKEIALSPDAAEAERGRRRALREARAAARLGGAGVVDVYDIVEADGRTYLIMELLDAPNLNTLVKRAGPMTPAAVAELGLRVLDILAAVHAAGIVHRDVKPSNVLIDGEDPRLTDFGIARLGDDVTITSSGVLMGTPAYIAPEHARGGEMGPAVDLYGLGATLYYAVEGVPPFGSGGPLATVMSVMNDPPRPVQRAGPLTGLLTDLLHKDPASRPDAAALRARLEAVARSVGRGADDAPQDGDDAAAAGDAGDGHHGAPVDPADGTGGAGDDVPDAVGADGGADAGSDDGADEPDGGGDRRDTDDPSRDPTVRSDVTTDQVVRPGREPAAAAGHAAHDDTGPASPPRPDRRRWGAAAVLAAVLLLGALALQRPPGDPGAAAEAPTAPTERAAGADPEPTPADGAGPAGASTPSPSAAASPSPSPGPSPSPSPTDGVLPNYDVDVPDDWVVADLEGQPYSVAHPPGWEVVRRGPTLTDIRDPQTGTYLRLDWVGERREPLTAWRRQEDSFRTNHAGYERLRMRRTSFRGHRAALWEYRYRDGGAVLRAYNLGVNRGGYGFALNLQARGSEFDAARELWPYFLASHRFEP